MMYRILIVDDEDDLTWGIKRSLENSGLKLLVHCVNDGNAAFRYVSKNRYDLVITDIRMPGRDGFNVIAAARQKDPGVSIILMTAIGSVDVVEKVKTVKNLAYIEKPFEMHRLKQLVYKALFDKGISDETVVAQPASGI
jgi:DNA-binding NtrC family response regulator